MRERSHTTPRRRGPKQPLPQDALYHDDSPYDQHESPYYTIDNTEDIYSTTLLPSQRCYVDPWDLENYDYVRKKIGQSPSPRGYYESSATPSPIEEPIHSPYYYEREPLEMAPRMASTMPRKRRTSHYQCQLECCNNVRPSSRRPSGIYDVGRRDNYDDYMISHMAQKFQNFNLEDVEPNLYGLYGGASTSSSTEPHSSLGDGDYLTATMPRKSSNYGALPIRKMSKPAPKLEFPAPPPSVPPTYDYCNPYATLPCCSVNDCYECQAAQQQLQQHQQQPIYGTHSIYGSAPSPDNCYDCSLSSSLGRRPSSSLYSGIYSSKFGMSKKGLLQIDYSCSWNDLDRIMTRNY